MKHYCMPQCILSCIFFNVILRESGGLEKTLAEVVVAVVRKVQTVIIIISTTITHIQSKKIHTNFLRLLTRLV